MTGKNRDKFSQVEGAAAAAPSIAALRKTAQDARELEIQIASIDAKKEELSKRLNAIKTGKLPTMMALARVTDFSLEDGTSIEINDFCSGSLPKDPDKRAKAMAWLEKDKDGRALIKTEVSLSFGKSEAPMAKKALAALKKLGIEPDSVMTGVHAQTLSAFARERLRDGKPVDTDLLGLYVGKTAKFTMPGDKAKGKKK